ncbi:MAG: glycoside hydrolase [Actinomycetia bacterium]|nr:glycoside hydrolase [Actinomycetes bacterium]
MSWAIRPLFRWGLASVLAVVVAAWLGVRLPGSLLGQVARLDRLILAEARVLTTHPVTLAGHTQASRLPPGMVLGYFYAPGGGTGAVSLLRPYVADLTGLIPDWYTIHADGTVTGQTDSAVLRFAAAHHLWTFALVQNMQGASVFAPLLTDPAAQTRALDSLLALVEVNGYDGVNLDFEGIPPADRAAFSAFVARLGAAFHRRGYYVTLSVPAETADAPADAWTGAYDYRALGRAADLLVIMAYDEHTPSGPPGPVAAAAWVQSVLAYAVRVVPPSKIVLGVPGYGYDWSAAGNQALSYAQAKELAAQHGVQGASGGHFVYWAGGALHTVWFEDASTFLSKLKLAVGYELRGIALWRLGIEDPRIWGLLR